MLLISIGPTCFRSLQIDNFKEPICKCRPCKEQIKSFPYRNFLECCCQAPFLTKLTVQGQTFGNKLLWPFHVMVHFCSSLLLTHTWTSYKLINLKTHLHQKNRHISLSKNSVLFVNFEPSAKVYSVDLPQKWIFPNTVWATHIYV